MKKKKENELVTRRIELLKKYYSVDEENKIITIKMHYNHASELLDYSVGEASNVMFDDLFLEKLNKIFERIPMGYKVDIILEIGDYDIYTEEQIMSKFNDLIELNSYDVVINSKKNQLISAILIIIGVIILIINRTLCDSGIYGPEDELLAQILLEFFDIASWVFIWQAVTVLFLSPAKQSINILAISRYLNSISLSKNGEIVITSDREKILYDCKTGTSFEKIKNRTLLITSTILFFLGLTYLINVINPNSWIFSKELMVYVIIINIFRIFIGIFVILAGASGLSRFSNNKIKLGFTYPIIIIFFIGLLLTWILSLLFFEPERINSFITLNCTVLVYLGYIFSSKERK